VSLSYGTGIGIGEIRKNTLPLGDRSPCSGKGRGTSVKTSTGDDEVAALQLGLDLGMNLIDTAAKYRRWRSRGAGRRCHRRPGVTTSS
jgi:diketogulonate reductase-like aldo/keto reductase